MTDTTAPLPPSPGDGLTATLPDVLAGEGEEYALQGVIAAGGMGTVHAARGRRLGRPVVIKVPHEGRPEIIQQFEHEVRLTARLQHPSIVPVYEAGRLADGRPFFAMKMVAGRTLQDLIGEAKTHRQRVGLLPHVLAVADAVAYAHSKRVIHRDLKPHNILVGDFGETVVIDWGIATDLPAKDAPKAEAGAVVGTPAYMAREQARGEPLDERADVYALGAILYQVLTGKPPYTGMNAVEIRAKVIQETPDPLRRLARKVPTDLAAVVDKAMSRSRTDRYPTARELAEDLRRFLEGRLVGAHSYATFDVARRSITSRVGIAAIGLLVAAALVLHYRDDRERARAQTDELILAAAPASLERDPTATIAWLKALSPERAGEDEARELAAAARARGVAHILSEGEECTDVDVSADGNTLAASCTIVLVMDLRTGAKRWLATSGLLALSPDGRRLAVMDSYHVELWDLATERRTWAQTTRGRVVAGAYSPAGDVLAAATDRGTIHLWSAETGQPREVAAHQGAAALLAFSPDGAMLASAGEDLNVRLWDPTGAPRGSFPAPSRTQALRFSPTGRLLAFAGDTQVHLWTIDGGEPRALTAQTGGIAELAFTRDGKLLASVAPDRRVDLWDLTSGNLRWTRAAAATVVLERAPRTGQIAFNGDGTELAVAKGGRVELVETAGGAVRELRGHAGPVRAIAFVLDGTQLVTASADGTLRLWHIGAMSDRSEPPRSVREVRAWLDGMTNAVIGLDGDAVTPGERILERLGLRRTSVGPAPRAKPATARSRGLTWHSFVLAYFGFMLLLVLDPGTYFTVKTNSSMSAFVKTARTAAGGFLMMQLLPFPTLSMLRATSVGGIAESLVLAVLLGLVCAALYAPIWRAREKRRRAKGALG